MSFDANKCLLRNLYSRSQYTTARAIALTSITAVPLVIATAIGALTTAFDLYGSLANAPTRFVVGLVIATITSIATTLFSLRRAATAYNRLNAATRVANIFEIERLNGLSKLFPETVKSNPSLQEILKKEVISSYEYRYVAMPLFKEGAPKRHSLQPLDPFYCEHIMSRLAPSQANKKVGTAPHENSAHESSCESNLLKHIQACGARPGGSHPDMLSKIEEGKFLTSASAKEEKRKSDIRR